jgi:hypothetical protein
MIKAQNKIAMTPNISVLNKFLTYFKNNRLHKNKTQQYVAYI